MHISYEPVLQQLSTAPFAVTYKDTDRTKYLNWRRTQLFGVDRELPIRLPAPQGATLITTDGVPPESHYEPGAARPVLTGDWLQHIADQQVLTTRDGSVTYHRPTVATDGNTARDETDRAGETDLSYTPVVTPYRSVAARLPISEEEVDADAPLRIAARALMQLNQSQVRQLLLTGRDSYTTGSGKTEVTHREPEGIRNLSGTKTQRFTKSGSSNFQPRNNSFLSEFLQAIETTRTGDQTPDLAILAPERMNTLIRLVATTAGYDMELFREMGLTLATGEFDDISSWAANEEFGCVMDSRFMGVRYKGHSVSRMDSHVNGMGSMPRSERTELALGYDNEGFSHYMQTLRVETRVAPIYLRPGAITMLSTAAS